MTLSDNVQNTSTVRLQFDVAKLELYLRSKQIDKIKLPIKVEQFTYGQSNPTYLLIDSDKRRYVLRKKPPGTLLSSTAHAVEREFKILDALGKHTDVPVPKVYVLCEDKEVIGTSFYIMEFVEGRIFQDIRLLSLSREERKQCWYSVIETLAKLHSVDYKTIGLADYGKQSSFYTRQIRSLQKVLAAQALAEDENGNKVGEVFRLNDMIAWFKRNAISDETTIVHGDFKVFHPTEPRVIGVLDWELSTIGHPLSDLANLLNPFYLPTFGHITGLRDVTDLPIPAVDELIHYYCLQVNRPYPIPRFEFAIVFSLFRLIVIIHGLNARVARKQASSAEALQYAQLLNPLIHATLDIIDKGDLDGQSKL